VGGKNAGSVNEIDPDKIDQDHFLLPAHCDLLAQATSAE
jgi:hypothetical protein